MAPGSLAHDDVARSVMDDHAYTDLGTLCF